jgi:glutaredoxin 3
MEKRRRMSTPEIIMYTTQVCPYCVRAKALLKRKGIETITEIDVSTSAELREDMTRKAGGKRTVPQIFIGGKHVGGCDDIYALDSAGKLDALLKA